MSYMDVKKFSMNIIEMRSIYRDNLSLSNDESDFVYKIILKELCDIDPIKIALEPNFNLSSESKDCLLYTSPSPRDQLTSRMPSSA